MTRLFDIPPSSLSHFGHFISMYMLYTCLLILWFRILICSLTWFGIYYLVTEVSYIGKSKIIYLPTFRFLPLVQFLYSVSLNFTRDMYGFLLVCVPLMVTSNMNSDTISFICRDLLPSNPNLRLVSII